MTTFVYDNAANQLVAANWVWTALTVNIALVNGNYVPKPGDLYVSQIPASAFEKRDVPMLGLFQLGNQVCGGKPVDFLALTSTFPIVGVIFYIQTGNDSTSSLIYYSSDAVGMPFLPKGLNWTITYNQLFGGYFQI
jgi:hypothetical protein